MPAVKNISPQAILFDFDGVLINSLPVMKLSFAAALRETYPAKRFNVDALFEEYCQYLGMGFTEIMAQMNLSSDMSGPFRRHSRYLARYVTLFDGAIELLEWCRDVGLTLGIATGKDLERTLELLQLLGIEGFFTHVYASDSVENPKPAPDMAELYAEAVGATPQEILLVGDAAADILCGQAAGCTTVAALWGYTPRETLIALAPDFLFESPEDAVAQIGAMLEPIEKAKAV